MTSFLWQKSNKDMQSFLNYIFELVHLGLRTYLTSSFFTKSWLYVLLFKALHMTCLKNLFELKKCFYFVCLCM